MARRQSPNSLHRPSIKVLAAANKRQLTEEAIKQIFDGKSDEINDSLFELYNKGYHDAVASVFGKDNSRQAQLFKLNLSRLAAAKTYRVKAILDRLRTDKDGAVRSWEDYRQAAARVTRAFDRYQAAEHDTFVSRCRTAKQFARFQEKAHIFPNLKWLMTVSANPRELHLSFVELTLPIDHPFWLDNQPGNLYNCKCDWTQTDDPASERVPDSVKPDQGLEGNPALTGEIVTGAHPYYKNTPNHIPDVGELMSESVAWIERETPFGAYAEHSLLRKEDEAEGNREIAALLLENGFKDIKLLPQIHAIQQELRIKYYGKDYADLHKTKCPDALIDGNPVEFKNTSVRNMSKKVYKASSQSNTILLKVNEPLTINYMERFARGQFGRSDVRVDKIIIINDGKVYTYSRKAKAE